MNEAKKNYIVDFFIFLLFIIISITGLIMFFIPKGNKSGYQEFLGIIKSNWATIHEWAGIIMIILVVIHIILHWKWIVSMTKKFIRI